MIRLLHISDVHLNAGYANKNEAVRHKLREGLNKAVKNAIDFAINENLDGIIIAGDFFDHDKISFKDASFVLDSFLRVVNNNQEIFYVTGNHDPMNTANFLEPLSKSGHFHLFDDDEIKRIDLVSKSGEAYSVVAVGHKSKNEQRNLIKNFPVKSKNDVCIGIAHASVPSALSTAEKENYMAVALSQIEALEYDYFALGHIHIRQKLTDKIGYSGNLQGLNIKEVGAKGGYLVSVDSGVTHLEDVNFNTMGWIQLEINLPQELTTLHALQDTLVQKVMEAVGPCDLAANQLLIRIHLEGQSQLKKQLMEASDLNFLVEMVKDKTGILSLELKHDKVRGVVNIESLMKEQTILSQMIHRIKASQFEPELLNKLYDLPIFPAKLDDESKRNYILQLKEYLIEDVVERMVVNKDDH